MEKWASPCTSVSILMLIRSLMALILALVTVPMRSQTYGITMATALRLTKRAPRGLPRPRAGSKRARRTLALPRNAVDPDTVRQAWEARLRERRLRGGRGGIRRREYLSLFWFGGLLALVLGV